MNNGPKWHQTLGETQHVENIYIYNHVEKQHMHLFTQSETSGSTFQVNDVFLLFQMLPPAKTFISKDVLVKACVMPLR